MKRVIHDKAYWDAQCDIIDRDMLEELNGGINCFTCVNGGEHDEPCSTCIVCGNFALFDRRGSRYGSLKM